MADLCDDILVEILLRPSYKHSRQCLVVCRRWRVLLSDLSFVSRFTTYSSNQIYQPFTLLYQLKTYTPKSIPIPIDRHLYTTNSHNKKKASFLSLDFLPTTAANVYILKSSNDLLLCSEDLDHHAIYYICNPLSKQWVSLPPTPSPKRTAVTGFYCDVSYDQRENENTTFWVNNKFKYIVMRCLVSSIVSGLDLELEIFSSETNTWRSFVQPKPQGYFCPRFWVRRSIIYSGMLWYKHGHKCIISYNPDHSNRWDAMGMPPDVYDCCHLFMGVSNGRMRVAQIFTYEDRMINNTEDPDVTDLEPSLRIWEYDNYNWFLVHRVYLKDLDEKFYHHLESMRASFLNIRQIHFHPVDGANIFIRLDSAYFEYNIRLKAMKFQPVEECNGRSWMGERFPFMMPRCPTPISQT